MCCILSTEAVFTGSRSDFLQETLKRNDRSGKEGGYQSPSTQEEELWVGRWRSYSRERRAEVWLGYRTSLGAGVTFPFWVVALLIVEKDVCRPQR